MTKAQQWKYICVDCGRKVREDFSRCPRCHSERVDKICCNLCEHSYDIDLEGTHVMCRPSPIAHGKRKEIGDRCDKFKLGDW